MIDTDELTCLQLVELVTEYLEGALPATDHARFEAHLADCDGCPTYVEQMRQTIVALGALSNHELPAPTKAALLRAFREQRQGDPPPL